MCNGGREFVCVVSVFGWTKSSLEIWMLTYCIVRGLNAILQNGRTFALEIRLWFLFRVQYNSTFCGFINEKSFVLRKSVRFAWHWIVSMASIFLWIFCELLRLLTLRTYSSEGVVLILINYSTKLLDGWLKYEQEIKFQGVNIRAAPIEQKRNHINVQLYVVCVFAKIRIFKKKNTLFLV